jgi:F0F1-type ATP synthase assembly protein I
MLVDEFKSVDDKLTKKELFTTLDQSEKQARSVVEASNISAKIYVIAGTVIMPILWSGFFSIIDVETDPVIFCIVLVILGLCSGFFFRKVMSMQGPLNAHFILTDLYNISKQLRSYAEQLKKQNDSLRKKTERLDLSVEKLSYALSESLIELDNTLACPPPKNHAEFDKHLSSILDPVSKESDFASLYGLDGNKVMLTIYLWDNKHEHLKNVFRRTKGKITEYNRTWKKRQGFAGTVFGEKKLVIENGIGAGGASNGQFIVSDKDKEHYRSAIGVPIIASNDEYGTPEEPIGVIVLTSNRNSAFDDKLGTDNRFVAVLGATARLAAIYLDFLGREMDDKVINELIFGD